MLARWVGAFLPRRRRDLTFSRARRRVSPFWNDRRVRAATPFPMTSICPLGRAAATYYSADGPRPESNPARRDERSTVHAQRFLGSVPGSDEATPAPKSTKKLGANPANPT
mmetsp:Transcript_18013/g.56244  ORF Transcript_18013/g.56244 Transcript_18013/m.56244 type:complete len:111 (-) Transcript_18013:331-663(-)